MIISRDSIEFFYGNKFSEDIMVVKFQSIYYNLVDPSTKIVSIVPSQSIESLSLSLPMHNGNLPFDSLSFSLSQLIPFSLFYSCSNLWFGRPNGAIHLCPGDHLLDPKRASPQRLNDRRSYISHPRTYLSQPLTADKRGQSDPTDTQTTLFCASNKTLPFISLPTNPNIALSFVTLPT